MSLFVIGMSGVNGTSTKQKLDASTTTGKQLILIADAPLYDVLFELSVATSSEIADRTEVGSGEYNIKFEDLQEVISKDYPGSQDIRDKNLKVGDKIVFELFKGSSRKNVFHIVDGSGYLCFGTYHLGRE